MSETALDRFGRVWTITVADDVATYTSADGAIVAGFPAERAQETIFDTLEAMVAPSDPVVTEPAVPSIVSSFAFRATLAVTSGADFVSLLDNANAWADQNPGDLQLVWLHAPQIRRDSDLIAALTVYLGLSDAQLDGIFTAAAAIEP